MSDALYQTETSPVQCGLTVANRMANQADAAALSQLAIGDSALAIALMGVLTDCSKILSTDGHLLFLSANGSRALDIDDPAEVINQFWWDLWPAVEHDRLKKAVKDAAAGSVETFTAFCPTRIGNPRWWSVTVSPVAGVDGKVEHLLTVSRDVTVMMDRQVALEAALSQSEILRREVDHRVKNSLTLVCSMLNLRAQTMTEPQVRDVLSDAAMRVRTIASVHDRLYRSDTHNVALDDYLAALCLDIQTSIGNAVAVTYDGLGHDLAVTAEASRAIGLVVAELTGNALRHAGLVAGETIKVALAATGRGQLALTVTDPGGGLPDGFSLADTGLGMTVVLAMIAQIKGELDWMPVPDGGTCFAVTFPQA
ncbi:histidine kinase dimerization/phosphoacceptor domain -containing protein [Loktanella sp. SALINAS62]|uniref:sensor histidine kinase n=1 Tax=Loktanella sp. SALINAS62 TaxID=2706124 RepID=UPI001B8D0259|nr:histidine kinase dimerization/phosphoacceptor domain -containing protein [Loktanella sp. SALINAS62]MBS1303169.1 PAS domain-containing protein [Loktanella sp. SALINAS62]